MKDMKLVTISSFIFLICLSTSGISQDIHTGLLMEQDKETPVLPDLGVKLDPAKDIMVDLKPYAPKPQDQGLLPSCVGWSVGYGALTIMEARRKNWINTDLVTKEAFSPLFIYNQLAIDKDCEYAGASFPSAFRFLKNQGTCKKEEFNIANDDCSVLPDKIVKRNAYNNRIKDYYQLFVKEATAKEKVDKTRVSLAQGFPVIVGMYLTPDFRDVTKKDPTWRPQPTPEEELYPHAMVVVGYNDVRQSFEIMNSWDTSWGNDGFVWVKYKDFAEYCVLAYQISLPDANEELVEEASEPIDPFAPFVQKEETMKEGSQKKKLPTDVELYGDFAFRYPMVDSDGDPVMEGDEVKFENAKVELIDNSYYSLLRKDWEIGQLFQLVAKDIKKDRYVYVFSINSEDNVHQHWPRTQLLTQTGDDKQHFGYTESPLVPYNNAKIIIPKEGSALRKDTEGDDYLYVLYSYEVIEDIDYIKEKIRLSSLPHKDRLQEVLGSRLIPYEEVEFHPNKISVKATSKSGSILGILIESKGQ
jgi:hypothetical protein